jgi:hypothetical protein
MDLRRLAPLALVVPAVAAGSTLKPHWPREQALHYDLGAAAPRVDELDVRWAPTADLRAAEAGGEWAREASFRYVAGQAPRSVTHDARLADGDYTVEIEIHAAGRSAVTRRKVTLEGGATTVDLASVVP